MCKALGHLHERVQSSCSSLEGRNCDRHSIEGKTVQRGEVTYPGSHSRQEAEGLACSRVQLSASIGIKTIMTVTLFMTKKLDPCILCACLTKYNFTCDSYRISCFQKFASSHFAFMKDLH